MSKEMKVYIISAVFPPEPVTSAVTTHDIAEAMVQRGHEVTVFASFPNRPAGKVMKGYRRAFRNCAYREGYRIIYSWHTLSKRSTTISRTAENLSFGITSTIQLALEKRPDIVYMNTWPLFAQWMNLLVLHKRRVPVVCAVKDLYPETLASDGKVSKNNLVMRLARAIGTQVYSKSACVVPINESMRDRILKDRGIEPEKVTVLCDWIDPSNFPKMQPKNGKFRKEHGFPPDSFLAMYVGSMTRMAGLDIYVEAAERLKNCRDIHILLVGDGAMRARIENKIQRRGLKNIRILYPLHPEDVPQTQAAADVLVLSLLPGAAEHATPSKLISYMFSQRPIIASVNANSPAAYIIQKAECGSVVSQGDADEFAAVLQRMADNRPALQKAGENARRYADEYFSKDKVLSQMCNLLERTASKHGA
jgi:colanic acid biosynthesis glycosyl transferase WcaI